MVAGLVSSVVSIVFGGQGIAAIASGGFKGTWSLKPDRDSFNRQAIFCLLGMLLLLVSLFSGSPKLENPSAEQIQRLANTITQQQIQIEDLKTKAAALADQVKALATKPPHAEKPVAKKRRP